jgi:hypothetical protein
VALSAGGEGEAEGRRVMLLGDLEGIFGGAADRAWLPTRTIIDQLVGMEERPWSEHSRGRPLNAAGLRSLLAPFGVHSTSDGKARGYKRVAFADAWARYLPRSPASEPSTRQEPSGGAGSGDRETRQAASGADKSACGLNPQERWHPDGLTGRTPEDGDGEEFDL